ncbi:MAG: dihydrolipoyl dehydrogenase [Halobacteriovoraceae bacterium]|nr:dihydrolipoyl dehydrogenase [Halobacteriovoraceae bacterium]
MKEFDIVVIGSGPGGYTCAIRCAQLGMKTAIVEKYNTLGGTCLNVGCIPSKAFLDSSERYHELLTGHKDHGIEVGEVKLNFKKLMDRVAKVVSDTSSGINYLMKKNKIEVFQGHGSFKDRNTLEVQSQKEQIILNSKKFIIATGSKPSSLPGVSIDKKRVITSTEALKLGEVPKHLVVIGGGVIGLELGACYRRLGSEVSVVEYAPSLVGMMDGDLAKELTKVFKKDGFKLYTGYGVTEVTNKGKTVTIKAKNTKNNEEISIEGDYCLVAVGRKAYTEGLGLEKIGIKTDERGKILVNSEFETTIPNIYAIGDVIAGAMLAHKAEEEGVVLAEKIAGQKPHIHYNLIPSVIYTWPEVASVGSTEEELKKAGISYKKGSYPIKALGRARASNEFFGFVKVLAHKDTDEILGVHMIGPRAADMIAEAVLAMEYRASAEDVARTCHAHPTYSEAFKEASLATTDNRAINI